MLRLHIKAQFAAFRTFTAGYFRPTMPFIPPSAAYGLALNLAGIETRLDDGKSPMTLMRRDLPSVEIALGTVKFPKVHSIFQQLHNYPVGTTGMEHAPECKGAKYNIQPVRREFLSGIDAYICLRGNDELQERISRTLRNGTQSLSEELTRYGIPFLGDNSFMIDILHQEIAPQMPAYWYQKLTPDDILSNKHPSRLTIWIDRKDMTNTITALYAPTNEIFPEPPDEKCWTRISPSNMATPISKKRKRKAKS